MDLRSLHNILLLLALTIVVGCGSNSEPQPVTSTDAGSEKGPDGNAATGSCEDGPGEVFETHVQPLLDQERPSSCSKCHAAGVDLAAFVREDACSSMACLVTQGLVDLDEPEESTILTFIDRGRAPAENTGVTDEMVQAEYDGFLAWIEWSASCMDDSCPSTTSQCAGPETPLRDAGTDPTPEPEPYEPPPLSLENYPCGEAHQAQAFLDWAFPSQGRCGHCHAQNGAIAGAGDAPVWLDYRRSVLGASRSIQNLYSLGAIDLKHPAESRLLLKPLHENAGGIEHGGGGKFRDTEDELYQSFLTWIEMQAACIGYENQPRPDWSPDKLRERYETLPYPGP